MDRKQHNSYLDLALKIFEIKKSEPPVRSQQKTTQPNKQEPESHHHGTMIEPSMISDSKLHYLYILKFEIDTAIKIHAVQGNERL
jgi:hypothetical protein